jgi:hypothetical protein
MRGRIYLAIAMLLMAAVPYAHAGDCGSDGKVWPADEDGSVRLTYEYSQTKDRLELIHREDENIIIARGLIADGRGFREVYATYDLTNGNLVHALAKGQDSAKQVAKGIPAEFQMQSHFDIQLFAADKAFSDEIKTLLSQNREFGCHDELIKLWQGRDFDNGKCGDTINVLGKIMMQLAQPETGNLKKLTENAQIQKYLEKIRVEYINSKKSGIFTDSRDPNGEHKAYCVNIQKMDVMLIEKLRKSKTQQELATRKKMPSYLDEPRDYEKTTVERYRY